MRKAAEEVPVSIQHGRFLGVVRRGEAYGRLEVGDVVVHANMFALKRAGGSHSVWQAVVLDWVKASWEERGCVYSEVIDCDRAVGDPLGMEGD